MAGRAAGARPNATGPETVPGPLYRAEAADTVVIEPLDALTLVYHRASGITHLLVSPAPEILAALGPDGARLDALLHRLEAGFALADADAAALAARLEELAAAGLVVRE
ncbi:MAG: HPr-rel-A system PqqD family peptide chaperone [Sphingomonas sp.]